VDSVGITVETDPLVQPFARTDNGEPALAACGAGEVLSAVTSVSNTVLSCVSASGLISGLLNLDDLGDVDAASPVSGTVLTYSAGAWRPIAALGTASNPLNLSQLGDVVLSTPAADQLLRFDGTNWVNTDDRVASMTDTNWCHVVSGRIVCDRPAPLMCSATEALSWNTGTNTWVCNDLGASIGQSIALNSLIDVTITTPVVGQSLLYDGSGWANSTPSRIMAGDSQVVVTDSGTNGLISFATEGQTYMAITNQGRIGVGVLPSAPYMMDISGSTRVAGDLTVTGNLNISGSQSIDGVIFANGGISMNGTVTSGNISATNLSATVADIRTLRVNQGLTVTGNSVLAGISATNISASGNISANQFIGDGSRITGVVASSADWYTITNIPTQVQAVSNSGAIVMAGISSTNISVTTNLTVGGALTAASAGFGPVAATSANITGQVSASQISVTTLQLGLADQCVGAADAGKIRYSGGVLQVCDGTGWDSLITNASTADRITSGTTNVIARTDGSISFTTAGVTTGYFYNGQLVANGVSLTGNLLARNISASQNVSVTGNVSANRFIGDGSLLTNISASSVVGYQGDRISSTNNQAATVATSAGTVSFTLGGVAGAAYLDPTLGLVINSVSTTGLSRFASISSTGNVSANQFIGDGSLLTNLSLGSIQAAGVTGSVQFKGNSNEISGTNTLLVNSTANRADLTVSGTVRVAGDGAEACSGAANYGQMRFVQDAGRMVMQICRP
jgi:cytoskeletal protein CcmA (bactofilin family)